jgi:hypothetical protein
LNTVCASGAAIFKGLEEDNVLAQGYQIVSKGAYYRLQHETGVAQFRYWLSTNKNDYKKMITFFNMQNNNKAVKEGQKLILDKIALNKKLFVPRIAKPFDLEESNEYDTLTDEKLQGFLDNPQHIDLSKHKRHYIYHTDMSKYEPDREVMIRLLTPYKFDHVDFDRHLVKQPAFPITKAIIHFHGGGFVC